MMSGVCERSFICRDSLILDATTVPLIIVFTYAYSEVVLAVIPSVRITLTMRWSRPVNIVNGMRIATPPRDMTNRILITGGAGFIGSHLADELMAHGYEVRVLDNLLPQVHGERPDG